MGIMIKSKSLLNRKGINPALRENNLKQLIQGYIDAYKSELQISIVINDIIVDTKEKVGAGKVKPILLNNAPAVNIELQDTFISFLENKQTQLLGEELIYHEVCHCRDIENLCQIFEYNQFPDYYQGSITVNRIYYELGYRLWGEYISYRKTYSKFRNMTSKIEKDFNEITKIADLQIRIFTQSIELNDVDIQYLYNDMKKDIYNLFYDITKKLARLHEGNDVVAYKEYCDLIYEIDNKIQGIGQLKTNIEARLIAMNSNYPHWEDDFLFVELGQIFFSFYNSFGLYISDTNKGVRFHSKHI